MRKLTILGPVKRVLPARVARYDRERSINASTVPLEKKTLNRKVHFGRGNFEVARSFFCLSFNIIYTMSSKPSFRVKLGKQQENLPPNPPTTTTFALPGTIADNKLQRKLQQQSTFNSLHIQKSRLAEWSVGLPPSTSAQSIQNSTTIAYGLPTTETVTLLNPLDR